jgi:periplasmic protein TonB
MAYGDRVDPTQRAISIVLTSVFGLMTVAGMYLAFNPEFAKKLVVITTAKEIKEEEPPPPPPPPPEEEIEQAPPIEAPPSPFPPPPRPNPPQPTPDPTPGPPTPKPTPTPGPPTPPPPPPPPPPPAKDMSKKASPQGSPSRWATTDDYPSRDLREENEGVARFSVQIGTNGRVTACSITGSSGHPGLDAATCKFVTSRARFSPALDKEGNPTTGSFSSSVRWVIPKE